jgi:antitoxin FitA
MAQLVVRRVEEELVNRLRERAAANQRSAEEEHRQILSRALRGPKRRSFAEVLSSMPNVGLDSDFARVQDV